MEGRERREAPPRPSLVPYITIPQLLLGVDGLDTISDLRMETSDTPQLLTLPEAAARLRQSRRTLERLIAAKEFPAPLKIGSRSLIPLDDLNEYFAKLIAQRNRRAST